MINAAPYNRDYIKTRADIFFPQAIEAGDIKLMKILEEYCHVNNVDAEGYSPLLVAVENNRAAIVEHLCQRGDVGLNATLAGSGLSSLHLVRVLTVRLSIDAANGCSRTPAVCLFVLRLAATALRRL